MDCSSRARRLAPRPVRSAVEALRSRPPSRQNTSGYELRRRDAARRRAGRIGKGRYLSQSARWRGHPGSRWRDRWRRCNGADRRRPCGSGGAAACGYSRRGRHGCGHPRAVQPSRPDAAVCRCPCRRGYFDGCARGERSECGRCGRGNPALGVGCAGGRRGAGRRGCRWNLARMVAQAAHRASACHMEIRHQRRWPQCGGRRQQSVDHQRGRPRRRASAPRGLRRDRRGHRNRVHRRSEADGEAPRRQPRRSATAACRGGGARNLARRQRVERRDPHDGDPYQRPARGDQVAVGPHRRIHRGRTDARGCISEGGRDRPNSGLCRANPVGRPDNCDRRRRRVVLAHAQRWRFDGIEPIGPDVLLSLVPQ